jgi:hypothetical protein
MPGKDEVLKTRRPPERAACHCRRRSAGILRFLRARLNRQGYKVSFAAAERTALNVIQRKYRSSCYALSSAR